MSLQGLISPFNIRQLQPASYDLTLGQIGLSNASWITLEPKQFILCSTHEKVNIPANIVARIEGKSSWARKGLIIHTAGFVDPGFKGNLTLEVSNLGNNNIHIRLGDYIAQIAFQWLDAAARYPYGHPALNSHYQDQVGTTESALS